MNAANDGDTVLVGPGKYTGSGNRDISLFGKAITVRSSGGPNVTIIDSQGSPGAPHRGFYLVHNESHQTFIEGFTITGGYLIGPTGGSENGGGGSGLYIRSSSPIIRKCIITNNHSATLGVVGVKDGRGGGVYIDGDSSAIIESCIISNNVAEKRGGGLYAGYQSSSVTVRFCLVNGNTSEWLFPGAGVYNALGHMIVVGCTIVDNDAEEGNGGGFNNEDSTALITNCNIWGNNADQGVSISNGGVVGLLTVEYSNVEGGVEGISASGAKTIWGPGNLDADPLFAAPEHADYHLSPMSPCIDAGSNQAVPGLIVTDLSGLARFVDDPVTPDTGLWDGLVPIVDIGAYEFGAGDCDNNGTNDLIEISDGHHTDCDGNGVPDLCQRDCNGNTQADSCDLTAGLDGDCNENGTPDACEIEPGSAPGGPYFCDPQWQLCVDCNINGVPDDCEPDCNNNLQADSCDIADQLSTDCNANARPDECDISDGTSEDCDLNDLPDECPGEVHFPQITLQPTDLKVPQGKLAYFQVNAQTATLIEYQWRRNGSPLVDSEHISGSDTSTLVIFNCQPEDAGLYDCVISDLLTECTTTTDAATLTVTLPCLADLTGDGTVGPPDLGSMLGAWGNPGCNGETPCAPDLNVDGAVGGTDLAILLGAWGSCVP